MLNSASFSIKSLLLAVVGVFVSIICVMGIYGYNSANAMKTSMFFMYGDHVVAMGQLRTVNNDYDSVMNIINDALGGNLDENTATHVANLLGEANELWKLYTAHPRSADEQKIIGVLTPELQKADTTIDKSKAGLELGDLEKLGDAKRELVRPYNALSSGLDKLTDINQKMAEEKTLAADKQYRTTIDLYTSLALFAAVICVMATHIVFAWVVRPINVMARAMTEIAGQKYDTVIPNLGDRNELGLLAGALDVFRKNGLERDHLVSQQEVIKRKAEEDKKTAVHKLVIDFEQTVGQIVNNVALASQKMQGTAQSLSGIAQETSTKATAAAASAGYANTNSQKVATSAEELTPSIGATGFTHLSWHLPTTNLLSWHRNV